MHRLTTLLRCHENISSRHFISFTVPYMIVFLVVMSFKTLNCEYLYNFLCLYLALLFTIGVCSNINALNYKRYLLFAIRSLINGLNHFAYGCRFAEKFPNIGDSAPCSIARSFFLAQRGVEITMFLLL
jgi:hypothetical protein